MSDQLPVPAASNTFERIKRVSPAGAEFWSAANSPVCWNTGNSAI